MFQIVAVKEIFHKFPHVFANRKVQTTEEPSAPPQRPTKRSTSKDSRQKASEIVQQANLDDDDQLFDASNQIETKNDLFAAIGDTSLMAGRSRKSRQQNQEQALPSEELGAGSPIQHYKAGEKEDIYAVPKSRTQSKERPGAQKSRTQSRERPGAQKSRTQSRERPSGQGGWPQDELTEFSGQEQHGSAASMPKSRTHSR